MTSRNEIVWIEKEMTADQISDLIKENLFEVYPVGDDSLDDILGVVFLKELFGKLDEPDFRLEDIVRPAQYFHEYTDVYKVLEQMQEKQVGYGLVCDEFGVFQGIVTHKDILEGLVGTISDETEEPDIIARKEGTGWLVDGQCPFYDFLEHFECEDLFAGNDYNTVGGLILEILEHIPQSGETLKWEHFTFEVVDMDGARIDKILVNVVEKTVEEEKV
jgi:putative hemolysin